MDLQQWCLWYKRRGAGRLRRILMREWDPIGVAGVPEARDEYDGYVGRVADQLRRDASNREIAVLLMSFRRDWMGLPTDNDADLHVANVVGAWYSDEISRWESRQVEPGKQQ